MSCNEDFWGEIMPVTRSFSLQSVVFLNILDKCPTSHPLLLRSSFMPRNANGRVWNIQTLHLHITYDKVQLAAAELSNCNRGCLTH